MRVEVRTPRILDVSTRDEYGVMDLFTVGTFNKRLRIVSILSFRRVLYVVCFLLGISPASEV